ncbi:MAG: precorrin-6y C5,15-methyltransferase (decarboxylating) subunit CbiE, partial [Cyanobacteria bacterium J06623_7]
MVIAVVGIGLDGAAGLSTSAREKIDHATVLAGGKRHLSYFAEHPAQKLTLVDLDRDLIAIAQFNLETHSIVILTSGDPLFFGLGRLLLSKFDPDTITFYPHLTSVQLACNRLKIPWQDAQLVSVHGRATDRLVELWKQGKEKIAVLTDGSNHPGAIARLFLSLELPLSYSFYICENLGDVTEKVSQFAPTELAKLSQLDQSDFASLNVIILLREPRTDSLELANLPLLGLPDSSFLSFADRPSLITKKEVRLAILGELALQPQQTVWDIGAGTGSVSIEIARLCPTSRIF